MPVDVRGFDFGPGVTAEAEAFTRLLSGGQAVQSRELVLGQQRAQIQREAQVRQALAGIRTPEFTPQTEQERLLAEQSAGLGGALAQAEQPQPIMSQEEKIQLAQQIDPAATNKIIKDLGLDTASKRAEMSRFAAEVENIPFNQRRAKIEERVQSLRAVGRDATQTAQLLDMDESTQGNALLGVQLADLSTKERFGVKAKQQQVARATGPKIGIYNPRDYTVESFAEFRFC